MPTETIIVVAAIVGVFVLFGSVVAWGQRQTRLAHAAPEPDRKQRPF